jgi:hypothetical protein
MPNPLQTHSRLSGLEPQSLVEPLSILVPHLNMRDRAGNGFTRNDRDPAFAFSIGWEQRGRCCRVEGRSEGVEQEGTAEALGVVRGEHAGASASASASVEGTDGTDLGESRLRQRARRMRVRESEICDWEAWEGGQCI